MMYRLLAMLAVLAALGASPPPAGDETPGGILRRWSEGPVRYLLGRRDESGFEALADDRSRALFIVRFWQRFDPTPGTLENENRRVFWQRVQEANRTFQDSVRPGWVTDRGRIFITLGPPDDTEIDQQPNLRNMGDLNKSGAAASASPIGGGGISRDFDDTPDRGLLRWLYRHLPSPGSGPETIIAFVRDSSGEWRLSRDPENYTLNFPGIAAGARDPDFGGASGMADQTSSSGGAVGASGGGIPLDQIQQAVTLSAIGQQGLLLADLGEALAIPEQARLRDEVVTSTEFLARLPIETRVGFRFAPGGRTSVDVGASVRARDLYMDEAAPSDARSFLLLYTRFTPQGRPEDPILASNESNPRPVTGADLRRGDGRLTAWTTALVPPGRYELSLGLQDAATGTISSTRQPIEVPDMTLTGLRLSSLFPSGAIEASPGPAAGVPVEPGAAAPAVAGTLEPRPPELRVSAQFARSESFGVYFEIYGLTSGQDGPLYDLTARFMHEAQGEWQPIGKAIDFPAQTGPARGWSFPLSRWPAGRFRLEVHVQDIGAAAGAEARGSLDFEVRE